MVFTTFRLLVLKCYLDVVTQIAVSELEVRTSVNRLEWKKAYSARFPRFPSSLVFNSLTLNTNLILDSSNINSNQWKYYGRGVLKNGDGRIRERGMPWEISSSLMWCGSNDKRMSWLGTSPIWPQRGVGNLRIA